MDDEEQNSQPQVEETPEETSIEPHPDQMELPGGKSKTKKPGFDSRINTKLIKKLAIAVFILAMLGVGGYFAWRYINSDEPAQQEQAADTQNSSTGQAEETSPLSESYSSTELRLDFKYPSGWNVQEGAGGIRVQSPQFSFETVDQGEVNGYFRLYIRKGARDVDSKYIGRGVAIKSSDNLSYNDPVPGQRKDTYLSTFGLDTENNFNFFIVSGNFNLKRSDTLGPDFGKEQDAYIIVGGYSSDELSEDLQMYDVPVNSYDLPAAYNEAVEIVKSLQLR